MHDRYIPPHEQDAWASRRRAQLRRDPAEHAGPASAAVVFDAYGTLFDVTSVETACTAITPDAAAFASLWRAKQLEYTWLRTLMGRYADFATVTAEALDYTLRRFAIAPDDASRDRLLAAWQALALYPDAQTLLDQPPSLPLGILSNGTPAMLHALLDHAGVAHRFQAVLSVDAVHAYKPDPRVYALAPAAFNVAPDAILFVTANAWDAAGAQAAGLRAAWCNRAGLPFDTHAPAPPLELPSLAHLPEALAR
jgi:2-haloacid dehalogenase